ncbi:MAG: hypothetical protein RBU23_04750 [Candidatus Auribacterota bacterium]|jgi:hypothetical protein|nr:hypothetical protein [Candidatus Auribacterota bacterium]
MVNTMARLFCVPFAFFLWVAPLNAHLCNDVFIQAKDNLAVKVDIRDNQLRINESAEFRVYLLNTMDRDIANIQLAIDTEDFDASVKPASDWRSYPRLKTKNKDGKKEYFIVKLQRRHDTAQGKYQIGLRLFNGEDSSMIFKTVDINDAMAAMEVPRLTLAVTIDGDVDRTEWKDSLLCTSLYEYVYEPVTASWISKQGVNKPSDVQTRFRFSHDDENLYGMIDFQTKSDSDVARIYLAENHDAKPQVITADLQKQTVTLSGNDQPLKASFSGTKIEFSVPLDTLNLQNADSFYVNVTRDQNSKKTYWRGNEISVLDPIVYANFILRK